MGPLGALADEAEGRLMTTKGIARHDGKGDWLRDLPEAVARAEARGEPIIVEWHGPMAEATQRLYATLGVLVRFLPASGQKNGSVVGSGVVPP